MLLGSLLTRNARRYPNKEGLIYKERRFTFAQLNERVNRMVDSLKRLGLVHGDHIAILAQNCNELMEMYFVAAKGGFVLVPLNYRLSPSELTYLINHSESIALFFEEEYEEMVNVSIKKNLKTVINYIIIGDEEPGMLNYEKLIQGGIDTEEDVNDFNENDLLCIIYTGGTTGLPKGVMLSHKNLLASALDCVLSMDVRSQDKSVYVLPLFHVSNWTIFGHMYMGATNIIIRKWDPEAVLKTIESEQATHINMVPTMVVMLLEAPGLNKYDTSTLRTISYAGSPMPVEVLKRGLKKFGSRFFQVYGLTEASPLVTYLPKEDHVLEGDENRVKKLNSIGKEMINVHTKVVDQNGDPVSPGEVGEIIVNGDNVMMGYWHDPEQTVLALRNGWLHTGDLATVDEDNYIYIVDRSKDMIICGGENIYPKEVENVLYQHPAILEAAVIGVPDDVWGESVYACIVVRDGYSVNESEIIEFCKEHLASYKKPKKVEIVKELPKTSVGKISKVAMREKFWSGKDRRV